MDNLATAPMITDEDECQLVSFTNKLPYYVRHLCKSNHKNKHYPTMTSDSSKFGCSFNERRFFCLALSFAKQTSQTMICWFRRRSKKA